MMKEHRRDPHNDMAGIIACVTVCAIFWLIVALAVWLAK